MGEGDWIGERLSPFGQMVTSVVPAGFEAYARVLHPAQEPRRDGRRLVRWAEVAAWSGMPLHRDAQFHSIALPPARPESEAPWRSQGPEEGSLYLPDAEALAGLAREWTTTTPQRCWFCVRDGYGWQRTQFASSGELGVTRPDPVPAAIRNGPRVRLPHRDYLLYAGPAGAVTAVAPLSGSDQTPNLWWPADQAWLDRPSRLRDGGLWTASVAGNRSSGTGWVRLSYRAGAELADEISSYLTGNVTGLVDG